VGALGLPLLVLSPTIFQDGERAKKVGTTFMASVNSLRGLLGTDHWKIPRVSPHMDGDACVQRRTIPLNELTDAINVVPTVSTYDARPKTVGERNPCWGKRCPTVRRLAR
jgi:hypothetical protein